MQADLVLPKQEDVAHRHRHGHVSDLVRERFGLLPIHVRSAPIKAPDRRLGILGLLVVGAILASSFCSILRYLW